MKILLTGATGGIGSAIAEVLKEHEIIHYRPETATKPFRSQFDWAIFAQGILNEEEETETLMINTMLPLFVTKAALSYINRGFIYISSTAGINGNSKFPVYSASKAALNIYCKSMAKAHPMLSFYSICPGPTDTKMWRSLGLEGNPQPPSAVAEAVKQCIGGKFLSGSIIIVRDSEIVCQ